MGAAGPPRVLGDVKRVVEVETALLELAEDQSAVISLTSAEAENGRSAFFSYSVAPLS